MANNKIILKKSSVADKVPQTTDLEFGELALNYTDGKLYFKDSSNEIKAFFAGQGSETPGEFTGIFTDNTLTGNGLETNQLSVNYPTINVLERSTDLFSVKLFPYLGMLLRYDDMQRDPIATVFDRDNTLINVMVG